MGTKKYVDIRVTAPSDADLRELLMLLAKIEECGRQGMSRTIPVQVDGDGSGQYRFVMLEGKSESANVSDIVTLDKEKMKQVEEGKDFETVYLGE